jgi:hypothetical protein
VDEKFLFFFISPKMCCNPYSTSSTGLNFIADKIIEAFDSPLIDTAVTPETMLTVLQETQQEWAKEVDLNLRDIRVVLERDLLRIGHVKKDKKGLYSLVRKKRISKRTSQLTALGMHEKNMELNAKYGWWD